jgi:mannan endo-1,4-beta-mannosidase
MRAICNISWVLEAPVCCRANARASRIVGYRRAGPVFCCPMRVDRPPSTPVSRARVWRGRSLLLPALVAGLGACGTSPPVANRGGPDERLAVAPLDTRARARDSSGPFVRVQGQHFMLEGRPLYVVGFNYWAAAVDARTLEGRDRVRRELDRLAAMGVRVLRILALSEGPDTEPWRIRPSFQPSPGSFAPEALSGLDWLMEELAERELFGVFMLNNFWFWSGGMAQYLSWARQVAIPYPDLESGRGWGTYERFCVEFYSDPQARALYERALEHVVTRYAHSPAVFAWELANEPHGGARASEYRAWIDETARRIESLDPNHLITTGSEGDTPAPDRNGLDVMLDHASPAIDFVSFHLWPENWGWTRAGQPASDFDAGVRRALGYIAEQVDKAARLGKPALLLETGLPRDGGSFEPSAPVTQRDRYLELVLQITLASAEQGGFLAGAFPWAWSGEVQPSRPGVTAAHVPLLGDPPHERQGWYGIYASDTSTADLISRYSARIEAALR